MAFTSGRKHLREDYLNGVAQILYIGHAYEGAPLAESTDESRKYITAALCGGRRICAELLAENVCKPQSPPLPSLGTNRE